MIAWTDDELRRIGGAEEPNDLQTNNEFDTNGVVEAMSWELDHIHPVDARRPRV